LRHDLLIADPGDFNKIPFFLRMNSLGLSHKRLLNFGK
jgi:hypothetical protein